MLKKLLILLIFFSAHLLAPLALAQNVLLDGDTLDGADTDIKPYEVIHWQVVSGRKFSDEIVTISLRLQTKMDFTLYNDQLVFSSPSGAQVLKTTTPPTRDQFDPITRKTVQVYYGGDFEVAFKAPKGLTAGEFPIHIRYIGCTNRICLFPYTEKLSTNLFPGNRLPEHFRSLENKQFPVALDIPDAGPEVGNGQIDPGTIQGLSWEDRLAANINPQSSPLWVILLIALLGGILTNLTPCVYPMIPITIRILGQQGQKPYLGPLSYAAGIFITYGTLGLMASWTGTLFGSITASPLFNFIFASLMGILGATMLGFGNLSRLQQIGGQIGSRQKGLRSSFFMGAAAGLVAAPCTGPVLAALLAYAATQNDFSNTAMMMLTYAFGFSLPYVLLGGAAAKASQLKAPAWVQVATKILFAGMMFGLSFYYLRIPFYRNLAQLENHWAHLCIASLLFGLGGAIIAVKIKNWHNNPLLLTPPAVLLGVFFFSSTQFYIQQATEFAREEIAWYKSEENALSAAKKDNRPVLIDMWAEWCEACKKMEATTFSDPSVLAYIEQHKIVLLKLDLTESNEATDALQERYDISGLPTLVLIEDPNQPQKFTQLKGFLTAKALLLRLKEHLEDSHQSNP